MRLSSLLLATLHLSTLLGLAEVEEEFPLGIEVVTGLRSDYIYRGFQLAGGTLDVQVESELALNDDLILSMGGWVASGVGNEFSEVGGRLEAQRFLGDRMLVGGLFSFQARDMSPLGDSQDLALYFQVFPTQDWDIKFLASRDFESDGWYSSIEGGWSHRVNDDAFLSISSGVSWVDAYYGRDGLNDFYGRLGITYVVNKSVSITPFAGWSILLDEDDPGKDRVFAGMWFEVVF